MSSEPLVSKADVVVIGGGPGGYVAAIRAAQMGKEVTVIEENGLGGVCLNRGCIPSKALISAAEQFENLSKTEDLGIEVEGVRVDFRKVQQWKNSIVDKLTKGIGDLFRGNKVKLIKGKANFINENEIRVVDGDHAVNVTFNSCIIATGSRPIELPNIPFDERILSSTEALLLQEIPKSMIVIGGGYIGIELGQAYSKFGTQVTILEGAKTILSGFDEQIVNTLKLELRKSKIALHTEAQVLHVKSDVQEVAVTFEANGEIKQLVSDYVLVTVGRRPNTDQLGLENIGVNTDARGIIQVNQQFQTNVPNIYAIGDIVPGPALAHKASYEGKVAAEVISGNSTTIDYRAIPMVVFSDPEIAAVGLTESEAHKKGYETITGKFVYRANGRALALNLESGFVTLVGERTTGRVLGAQIVGKEASNLIAEIVLAIEMGGTLEDISLSIHGHPSLGEMVMEAAEASLGKCVHALS